MNLETIELDKKGKVAIITLNRPKLLNAVNEQLVWDFQKATEDVKNDDDKSFYLIKDFKFKNFEESQNFVNKVGKIAEQENHHPDISFGWGYCKIKIFTHAIKGLAESDFILAAKIDKLD